ncbi:hypothetical protein [Halobacillus mangrovi]|uniref:hypothetical protein n=1 Tax=Halobacillus mangrovi TaxID=402384 RepID=UPI003D9786D2
MREDMIQVLDQRDYLVKENKRLQEELEQERMKVSLLKQEQKLNPEILETQPLGKVGV